MECENCGDLRVKFKIELPSQLKKTIKVVRQNVEDGTIRLIAPVNSYCAPFEELKTDGPWDDVIGYEFICDQCGTMFSLSCDTYHGNGRWDFKYKTV